ncbi:MAG: hypothetical protein PHQ27_03695 [Victivallales bacterium]|nr:hypothetical protein [Victivallales bacterium]
MLLRQESSPGKLWWNLFLITGILLVLGGGLYLWHFRPLLRSHDILAMQVDKGEKIVLPVYYRPGFPGEYWFYDQERWFVFIAAEHGIFHPNHPSKRPYLHFNHDMHRGYPIDFELKSAGKYLEQSRHRIVFTDGHQHFYRIYIP